MRFFLNLLNNISENSKQQLNSENVLLSIFVTFYIFWQLSHISVSADWFHNHNGKQKSDLRKSNQLCTPFFFFFWAKRIRNRQWFRTFKLFFCSETVSIKYKQFFMQLCEWMIGWFKSVIKYNLPSRLKFRRDAFYFVNIFCTYCSR